MNKTEDLEKAFIELVKNNERVIYKVCSFYVSENYTMEDLYQDVVCNLWSGFGKFRNECSVSTWIYRVALNTCISGLRKHKRNPRNTSLSVLHESISEPESINAEIREIYPLIRSLKPIERTVILLFLEEKSYREISEITGLTVSNVAIKLKRTKDKLKKMFNS